MKALFTENTITWLLGIILGILCIRMLVTQPDTTRSQTPSTPTPPLQTSSAPLVGFDLLGETVPDEDYRPVYPEALRKLDQQTITIRGFMTPYDSLENLANFMIMSFPTGCNFCAPPAVDQVVLARQPQRRPPYSFIEGPIEVTGTLKLWNKGSSDPAHRDEYFLYIMTDVEVSSIPPELFKQPESHLLHTMPSTDNVP